MDAEIHIALPVHCMLVGIASLLPRIDEVRAKLGRDGRYASVYGDGAPGRYS